MIKPVPININKSNDLSNSDNINVKDPVLEQYYKEKARQYQQDYIKAGGFSVPFEIAKKYEDKGIMFNPQDYTSGALDKQLADAQSNWEKAFNSLAQTVVSEIGLGTIGAFSDLFDFVGSNILHITNDDYQNPVSKTIEDWQNYFNENIAPIYTTPGVDIAHGGFKDFGWWMSNIPSIASSLTLLIPARAASAGIGALGKAMKINKATSKARSWLGGAKKVEQNAFNRWISSGEHIAKRERFYKNVAEGTLMRTMENYQEARQVHTQTYENALDTFSQMDDEEFAAWVAENQDMFDNDVNLNDRDSVAKSIAKQAADRTFTMDFSNVVFDIIQLYGLKNVGKLRTANQLGRTGGGASVQAAQRASIAAAGEFGGKVADKTVKKFNKLRTAGNYVKDFGKKWGLTALEESTEGVEEIVNYIAQQEGITYGKALLDGKGKDYKVVDIPEWTKWVSLGLTNLGEIANVISTWSNLQNPLGTYWDDAELQESAFWGFIGGLVFGGAGSAINKAQLIRANKRERDAIEKQTEADGEGKKTINQKIKDIMDLADEPDAKAAKTAITKRQLHLETLKHNLDMIDAEDARNPFAKPDKHNVYPKFNSVEEKEIARQKAIDQYEENLVMDAIFSGTYDMLLDYWQSDGNKAAMIKLGLAEEGTASNDIDSFVKHAEFIKQTYDNQIAKLMPQIDAINAGTESGYEIPISFVQEIARENTQKALQAKNIDRQINILDESIANQENLTVEFDNDPVKTKQQQEEVKRNIELNHLFSLYTVLDLQRKALEHTSQDWNTIQTIKNIKKQQKQILTKLKSSVLPGTEGTVLGNYGIRAALEFAGNFELELDEKGQAQFDEKGKIKYKRSKENFERNDKEIEKAFNQIFEGDTDGEVYNWNIDKEDTTTRPTVNKIRDLVVNNLRNANKKEAALNNKNAKLIDLYKTSSNLKLEQMLIQDSIAKTRNEIKDKVDYLYNRYNSARKRLIISADETISSLYKKYTNKNKENGKQIVSAITTIYTGAEQNDYNNKQQAEDIIRNIMSKADADKFLNALDIFKQIGNTKGEVYQTIMTHIITLNIQDKQEDKNTVINEEESSSKSENSNTEQQNQEGNNISETPQETITRQETPVNEPPATPRQQIKLRLKFDAEGNYKGAENVKSRNGRGYICFVNPDGTIEVYAKGITKVEENKLVNGALLARDEGIDELEDKTYVSENPILEFKNGRYILVKPGRVSLVTEETEVPPVEENEQTQVESKQETELDEGSKETQESAEVEEEETEEPPKELDFDKVSDNKSEPSTISSTGEISEEEQETTPTSDTTAQADLLKITKLKAAANNELGNILEKNNKDLLNINSIDELNSFKDELVNNLYNIAKDKGYTKEEVEAVVEELYKEQTEAITFINSLNNEKTKAAAALGSFANESRREEVGPELYGSLFDMTAKKFLSIYCANTVLPKTLDGKEYVSLEDILRIVNNAYGSDGTVGRNLFNLIKAYLNTEENQKKYKIIDNYKEAYKIINDASRLNISEEQIEQQKQNNAVGNERIELAIGENTTASDIAKAQEILSSLKQGDKLEVKQMIKKDRNGKEHNDIRLGRTVDGKFISIASMPLADYYPTGGIFKKVNSGWNTDLSMSGETVVSNCMTVIENIFLGNEGIVKIPFAEVDLGTKKDVEELRQIISEYKYNSDNTNLISKLINNKTYQNLIKQSRENSNKEHGFRNILYIERATNEPNHTLVLDYLASLWNYCTLSTSKNDIELNKKILSNNIHSWFTALYNTYNGVKDYYNSIQPDSELEISAINNISGSLIKPVENALPVFNKPSEVVKDLSKVHLGFASNDRELAISGYGIKVSPAGFGGRGNTFVMVDSNNDQPDYTRARGINLANYLTDDKLNMKKGTPLYNMFAAVNELLMVKLQRLRESVVKGSIDGKTEDAILNEVYDTLTNIFECQDYNSVVKNTALLRANPSFGKVGFRVAIEDNPVAGFKGITLQYISNNKMAAEVKIFTKTKNNTRNGVKELAYTVNYVDKKTGQYVHGKIYTLKEGNNELFRPLNEIMMFALRRSMINISEVGIKADDNPYLKLDGFYSRTDDGKVKLNIDSGHGKSYEIEADSYSELLLNNDYVEINLDKDSSGNNFQQKSSNQRLNQTFYVSLPTNKKQNNNQSKQEQPITKKDNDFNEVDTDDIQKLKLKAIITSDSNTKAIDIFKEVLGEEEYNRFANIVGSEFNILDSLLPNKLDYNPDLNYYYIDETTGEEKSKGVNAYSLGNRKPGEATYKIFDKEGNPKTASFKEGQEVIFGPRLLNALSSRDKFRREQAIRKLIHERLHNLIQQDSDERNALLKSIEDIYNEFIKVVDERHNNIVTSKDDKKVLERIIKILEPLRNNLNRKDWKGTEKEIAAKGRLLEEFLVESLTNKNFVDILNSIEVEGETDNGKESLFSKILKAIAKFFGWEIKDNTLYMKEVNALANALTSDTTKSEPVTEDNTANTSNETVNDESKEDKYGKYAKYFEDDEEGNESREEEIDFELNYNIKSEITTGDISSFKNHLSSDVRNKFQEELDNGEISIKCKQ